LNFNYIRNLILNEFGALSIRGFAKAISVYNKALIKSDIDALKADPTKNPESSDLYFPKSSLSKKYGNLAKSNVEKYLLSDCFAEESLPEELLDFYASVTRKTIKVKNA